MAISSTECSSWFAVYLTITVAIVAVNLLSIILFVKNSNLRTRAMYLVINLTVADMFVGGIYTFVIVFHFLLYGYEVGNKFRFRSKQFLAAKEWQPFLVLVMIDIYLSLTSVTGTAVISLHRIHATFRPFKHRNIKKWVYGATIAGVWILTAIIFIAFPLTRLHGNLQQQWQLLFPLYLLLSYCCLCFIAICVSYTSIVCKIWCSSSVPWCCQYTKKKLL